MTKDTSREAAVHFVDDKFGPIQAEPSTPQRDRGQRALAERLWGMGVPRDKSEATKQAAAILGEHGVYLPDGSEAGAVLTLLPTAELERLQRIKAAARKHWCNGEVLGTDADGALRAALATDGAET